MSLRGSSWYSCTVVSLFLYFISNLSQTVCSVGFVSCRASNSFRTFCPLISIYIYICIYKYVIMDCCRYND